MLGIETTPSKEIYINPQIIARGSETMLQKLKEGAPLFFTISISEFKTLLQKAIKKDRGHQFSNCHPFFIPNSYLEIHVEKDISILADRVALQFRKRKDDRGLNIFVCKSDNPICHTLQFDQFPDKEEYYNELYLKTKRDSDDLFLSVKLSKKPFLGTLDKENDIS